MRTLCAIVMGFSILGISGCYSRSSGDQQSADDTAAYKAGKAAHKLAKESEEAAKALGHTIQRDAHEAHEGWKESAQEDRDKQRK